MLIVDDEPKILKLLDKAFTKKGYDVFSTETPLKALEIQKRENIQVMFFDLHMPEMNGLELCRLVRANNPMALIYAMTGYSSLFELSDCREAGFDDYFNKPIKMPVLLEIVEDSFKTIDRWKKGG